MRKIVLLAILLATSFSLASCERDADVVSRNLSYEADDFWIDRRVVFYNWITWQYILEIDWRCSIWNDNTEKQFSITCKVWEDRYKKHFLWLSDNVTYFVEQLEPKNVSSYHYKVIFKPQEIIPDIDFKWSTKDIPKTDNND